jgi:hypothetical protein
MQWWDGGRGEARELYEDLVWIGGGNEEEIVAQRRLECCARSVAGRRPTHAADSKEQMQVQE